MKIEEAIKIYEFLGNLNGWSFLGIYLLLMLAILALVVQLRDKLGLSENKEGDKVDKGGPVENDKASAKNKTAFNKLLVFIGLVVTVALVILFWQAKNNIALNRIGLRIKSDYSYHNFTQKSFRELNFLYIPEKDREERLKELVEKFPDEFTIVRMTTDTSVKNTIDTSGIGIIDPVVIDAIYKSIDKKAGQAASLVKSFAAKHSLTILYCDAENHPYSIQDNIDNSGWLTGSDFFQSLIGKDSLFPVYNAGHRIIGFTLNNPGYQNPQDTIVINNIMGELQKRHWNVIGFKRLRENTGHPEYTDDMLKRVINNSGEKLLFTPLAENDDHDILGILLPPKKITPWN